MSGGTGNFLLEKAEAFALRIVRLYQHLSEKGERVMSKQVQDSQIENLKFRHSYFKRHTSYFAIMVKYTAGKMRGKGVFGKFSEGC